MRSRLAAFLIALACASPPSAGATGKVIVIALFKDKAMVSVDGKRRLLRVGQTSPEGVTLIAADSEQAMIEVAGERRAYKLGAQIASSFERPAVRIPRSPSGLHTIAGTINGRRAGFVVDTGATLVTMNGGVARRAGIDYRSGTVAPFTTALGDSTVYVVRLDRVQIGDIVLLDVEGAVHEGDFPTDVLLGQSFLARVEMRRDGAELVLTQ